MATLPAAAIERATNITASATIIQVVIAAAHPQVAPHSNLPLPPPAIVSEHK